MSENLFVKQSLLVDAERRARMWRTIAMQCLALWLISAAVFVAIIVVSR